MWLFIGCGLTITPQKNCTTCYYIEQHESTIGCIHSSWAPDDGRVTPETCRALLSIKSIKSWISLVIYMIFIYNDARSHEHKKNWYSTIQQLACRVFPGWFPSWTAQSVNITAELLFVPCGIDINQRSLPHHWSSKCLQATNQSQQNGCHRR